MPSDLFPLLRVNIPLKLAKVAAAVTIAVTVTGDWRLSAVAP